MGSPGRQREAPPPPPRPTHVTRAAHPPQIKEAVKEVKQADKERRLAAEKEHHDLLKEERALVGAG